MRKANKPLNEISLFIGLSKDGIMIVAGTLLSIMQMGDKFMEQLNMDLNIWILI